MLFTAAVLILLVVVLTIQFGLVPVNPADHERGEVIITDCEGTEKAVVNVRFADSFGQQYVGLSDTNSLADDEGMLFTYEEEDHRAFSMRRMDFPLDIIFVDGDGQITKIDSMNEPESVGDHLFQDTSSGTGQYVLEVNKGWAERHGIEETDCLEVSR